MANLQDPLPLAQPMPAPLAERLAQGARATFASLQESHKQPSPAELMGIVSRKNDNALRVALATGVNVNFLAFRTSLMLSPLALSCKLRWPEGTQLLLAAGARDSAAFAAWNVLSAEQQKAFCSPGVPKKNVAHFIEDSQTFSAVLLHEPPTQVEQRKRLALAAFAHVHLWGAQALVDQTLVGFLDAQHLRPLEESLFALPPSYEARTRARLLSSFWDQSPQTLQAFNAWRLAQIVRQDGAELFEGWVQRAQPKTVDDLQVELFPRDFQRIKTRFSDCDWLPFPHIRRKNGNTIPSHLTHTSEMASLWVACVLLDARRCLRALSYAPEIAQASLQHPEQKAWLSMAFSAGALREAQRQGLVLFDCVNQSNENPLHFACAAGESKKRILELAKLCPAWIAQRDRQQRLPMDLLAASVQRDLLVAQLEQLALGAAMGVERAVGKKAVSKSSASQTLLHTDTPAQDLPTLPVRTRRL